jgi:hypothetical protein
MPNNCMQMYAYRDGKNVHKEKFIPGGLSKYSRYNVKKLEEHLSFQLTATLAFNCPCTLL